MDKTGMLFRRQATTFTQKNFLSVTDGILNFIAHPLKDIYISNKHVRKITGDRKRLKYTPYFL